MNKERYKEIIVFTKGQLTEWHFNSKETKITLLRGEGILEIKGKHTIHLNYKKHKTINKFRVFRFGSTETSSAKIKIEPTEELVFLNDKRHYKSTNLKTRESDTKNSDFILKLYSEVNSNYRHLADIRFKLLALVPAVSVIVWATLIEKISSSNIIENILGIFISILAIRIIWGIKIYDKRNDELYDNLISRGRKIEEELELSNGIFLGRVKSTKIDTLFKYFRNRINHSTGTRLIYSSVEIGWISVLMYYLGSLILNANELIKSWL